MKEEKLFKIWLGNHKHDLGKPEFDSILAYSMNIIREFLRNYSLSYRVESWDENKPIDVNINIITDSNLAVFLIPDSKRLKLIGRDRVRVGRGIYESINRVFKEQIPFIVVSNFFSDNYLFYTGVEFDAVTANNWINDYASMSLSFQKPFNNNFGNDPFVESVLKRFMGEDYVEQSKEIDFFLDII